MENLRTPQCSGLSWLACALAAISVAPVHAQVATETVLHTFSSSRKGVNPVGGVVRGPGGNLYGTTAAGGSSNAGVVYRVETTGHETVLYAFTGGADGSAPNWGLISDPAGNLYGTTTEGGTVGGGVIYKLDTTGHETVLYSFPGGGDGLYPNGGLTLDSAGNLYGTTSSGGRSGQGILFKLNAAGGYAVLHSFTGGADGGAPGGALIGDGAGNLYGTASAGGTFGKGVVYKLDAAGDETVLHNFGTGNDGGGPIGGVIRDSAGNLFGAAANGGPADEGLVYKLDATGEETTLYSFTGGADGGAPNGDLTGDSAGNLYGTTALEGHVPECGNFGNGCGVVYKLDKVGHETVLYTFSNGTDGDGPVGVIRDAAGSFFGVTHGGGTSNAGVVYGIDTAGQGGDSAQLHGRC